MENKSFDANFLGKGNLRDYNEYGGRRVKLLEHEDQLKGTVMKDKRIVKC